MNCDDVRPGIRVKTTKLESTDGMMIHSSHLTVRQEGIVGTVKNYVPGHGGDVLFVQHDNSTDVGTYCYTELELE